MKKIIIIFLSLLGIIVIWFLNLISSFDHKIMNETWPDYTWLIKKEHRESINCPFNSVFYSDRDVKITFHLNKNMTTFELGIILNVWILRDMGHINLNNIFFNKQSIENNMSTNDKYDVLDTGSEFESYVKHDWEFNDAVHLNYSNKDTILYTYEKESYKGLYGKFETLDFQNEKGKTQFLLTNKTETNLMSVVLCKKGSDFYVFCIKGFKFFEKDLIEIFELIPNGSVQ